jgi:hypothetical protein
MSSNSESNTYAASETLGTPVKMWKSPPPMRFDLIFDVMNGFSAKIGSIVPVGRGYFLIIPGTSCMATIVLSLRDKDTRAPRLYLS